MRTWSYTGALYQYLLANGVGVLVPNIRGSSGFGMTYQRAIYRSWGDGDVRDLAACVAFLSGQDWVDADRLGVFGASYGGFAVLSCLTRMPDAWRVGVDLFGPSDLVHSARAMPPYWQRRLPDWIGDPDTEADLLRARSPLTHVDRIRSPLLVIQGTNDARVARASSDAVVDRLHALGRRVEYDVISGEGHGFDSRKNYVQVMSRTADWLLTHLR
jgi:dipeptidyl aminopeptidase/acylaminoacyl peptidase